MNKKVLIGQSFVVAVWLVLGQNLYADVPEEVNHVRNDLDNVIMMQIFASPEHFHSELLKQVGVVYDKANALLAAHEAIQRELPAVKVALDALSAQAYSDNGWTKSFGDAVSGLHENADKLLTISNRGGEVAMPLPPAAGLLPAAPPLPPAPAAVVRPRPAPGSAQAALMAAIRGHGGTDALRRHEAVGAQARPVAFQPPTGAVRMPGGPGFDPAAIKRGLRHAPGARKLW